MKKPWAVPACMLLVCILAACAKGGGLPENTAEAGASVPFSVLSAVQTPAPESNVQPEPLPCYFTQMAEQAVENMHLSGSEAPRDKVLAAYRYVIENTFYAEFEQPVLVDNWRYEDACGQPPTVYEVMAAGPLVYGFGTCEDYSAALIVLLEHMGFEALYVPGLTFSVHNTLVDHAWVMVNVEGTWYHIDPQLEDNVIKGPTTSYRYFLKGDEEFAAHHVWGSALRKPDPHSLTLPPCPASAPAQPPSAIAQTAMPNIALLEEKTLAGQRAGGRQPSELQPSGFLPPLPRFVEADPALQAWPDASSKTASLP